MRALTLPASVPEGVPFWDPGQLAAGTGKWAAEGRETSHLSTALPPAGAGGSSGRASPLPTEPVQRRCRRPGVARAPPACECSWGPWPWTGVAGQGALAGWLRTGPEFPLH